MSFKTPDLCDEFEGSVRVAEPLFRNFGGAGSFCGPIATVRVFEDNVLVRETLETEGRRRVLIVDAGGSPRCALMGEWLARFAYENGWAGVIINRYICDPEGISKITVGIRLCTPSPSAAPRKVSGSATCP